VFNGIGCAGHVFVDLHGEFLSLESTNLRSVLSEGTNRCQFPAISAEGVGTYKRGWREFLRSAGVPVADTIAGIQPANETFSGYSCGK
jgi:hypothetical protein